jgi:hypothetical protein
MRAVKVKCLGKIDSQLQFVKTMKSHTRLGLKEAKDLCDSIRSNEGQEYLVYVDSPEAFEKEVREMVGPMVYISNREKERQVKLVALGLGDDSDKIDLIADELASKLLMVVKQNQSRDLYPIFKDFLFDVVSDMTSEQLDELFNKNYKNQQEQNDVS